MSGLGNIGLVLLVIIFIVITLFRGFGKEGSKLNEMVGGQPEWFKPHSGPT